MIKHFKTQMSKILRIGIAVLLIISSTLAMYIKHKGADFDIVAEIAQRKADNLREDGFDLATTFDKPELAKDFEYSTMQKIKSFSWNGAIKGEVYDTFSAIGAITSDLCVYGDIRDVAVNAWRYSFDSAKFDLPVMMLSSIDLILVGKPFLAQSESLAKNTIKYMGSIPPTMKRGVIKTFVAGETSVQDSKKIWDLLKKTRIVSPARYLA